MNDYLENNCAFDAEDLLDDQFYDCEDDFDAN